jgi:MOSC domain-containing protein YiiM
VGPGDFGENLTVAGLTEEAAWSVRRAARAMLARNERLAEAAALARCGALSEAWRERLARS